MRVLTTLFRLAAMRRRAGASPVASLSWATGLLWRNHEISQQSHHSLRQTGVERRARIRLYLNPFQSDWSNHVHT